LYSITLIALTLMSHGGQNSEQKNLRANNTLHVNGGIDPIDSIVIVVRRSILIVAETLPPFASREPLRPLRAADARAVTFG